MTHKVEDVVAMYNEVELLASHDKVELVVVAHDTEELEPITIFARLFNLFCSQILRFHRKYVEFKL